MANNRRLQIDELLTTAQSDLLNLSWYIYHIIGDSETPEDDLRYLYETYYDSASTSNEKTLETILSKEDSKSLKKMYGELIDAMLASVQTQNLSEEEFYDELWNKVIHSPFFPSEREQAFALYYVWIDKRVPYFQLGEGKRMSNESYRQYISELSLEIKKVLYILNTSSLSQKTERASLILDIIQGISSRDKQIVLLSNLISELGEKSKLSGISELLEKLS